MLLEEDTSYDSNGLCIILFLPDTSSRWRHSMKRKVYGLEEAMNLLSDKLSIPELKDLMREPETEMYSAPFDEATAQQEATPSSESISHDPSNWEVVMDESGPAAMPASCVAVVPPPRGPNLLPSGDRSHLDLVARGLISLEVAESFFLTYRQKLDHHLYRILIDHDSFSSVRASSPLLTAAICTVGALHNLSTEFNICYEELIRLSSNQVFSKENTADDVRALCIGALWLSDVSSTLIGLGNISNHPLVSSLLY
jgi:hypothetical protein